MTIQAALAAGERWFIFEVRCHSCDLVFRALQLVVLSYTDDPDCER
jgi:hypothetical protein